MSRSRFAETPVPEATAWAIFEIIPALAVFAMMLVGIVDVAGRKLASGGAPAAVELTELLMMAAIYTALPLVSHRGGHVRLDLLDEFLPPWANHMREAGGEFLAALLMCGGGWLALQRAIQAWHEKESTVILGVALAPFYAGVAMLFVLAAAVHLARARATTREHDA